MQTDDFSFYQKLLIERSGLALNPEKTYLLETRLTPVAQSLGYATLSDMTTDVRRRNDPAILNAIIEAMTTNETSFFRDNKPFAHLKDVILPHVCQTKKDKTIRIWSAACSTGQEPYSIAMTISEFLAQNPGWKVEIVATDISQDVLKRAQQGEYNQFEIQRGLPIQMMIKYFSQVGTNWKVKDTLRNMISFKTLNLVDPIYNINGPFDIIFCRNVLIYFNQQGKAQALAKMTRHMTSDGVLMLGSCETVMGLPLDLQSFAGLHGIYSLGKKGEAAIAKHA
ncbi:MAG TPA: protein-glutamate O-methyltransferase CheR [Alphaproteobacteria bacterium]